jgi:prepilin-type N-terminal cleavage/methylation domain-containing protein
MKKNKGSVSDYRRQDGFTLIELLVVVAIIGILTSIVLVNLNLAKNKAKDSKIKSSLSSIGRVAELYFSIEGTYAGICNTAVTSNGATPIGVMVSNAARAGGFSYAVGVTGNGIDRATCNLDGELWAVQVPLTGSRSGGTANMKTWCVDSRGISKFENTVMDTEITNCP